MDLSAINRLVLNSSFLLFILAASLNLPTPCHGTNTSFLSVGFPIRTISPSTSDKSPGGIFRLPKAISPIHYDLEIRPIIEWDGSEGDRDKLNKAPGRVIIRVKCLKATNSIILHAKLMEIYYSMIMIIPVDRAPPVWITGFSHDDDREIFTIFLASDLIVDEEYLLYIPFQSEIPSEYVKPSGIYTSKYTGSDGNEKTMISTIFQKVEARSAFPCFDEPSRLFKATFSLRLGRSFNYKSYSNTDTFGDPEPIPGKPGWVWDIYEKTIKLPTYSFAFALTSDYAVEVSPPGIYRLPIRTWVPRSQLTNSSAKFSARLSANVMNFFEELFDFKLPISKMENLAMSTTLSAMEHAGLVAFRPEYLLWDADENTQLELYNSTSMIAHEYSHMWIGNLVTCEWWNDFWLNEGFARYFQLIMPKEVIGVDFRPADRVVSDIIQGAMALDAGPESMPVHRTRLDRIEIAPAEIDYDKAAALLRMMETFITKKTFYDALRIYVRRHQYSNVVQDDLFQVMTEQARADGTLTRYTVKEIMDTWMNQKGFPVIRVSRASNGTIYIQQHRFTVHPHSHDIGSSQWYVPIWYISKSSPKFQGNITTPQYWLDNSTITSTLTVKSSDEWILINPEARGYYRVIYDDHLTKLIMRQLETDHTVFNSPTRSQLMDDFFQAALARYIPIQTALDVTTYLPREDDLIVWTTVLNNFREFHKRLVDTDVRSAFVNYILSIIVAPLRRLGVVEPANDSPSNIMIREHFLNWACAFKHELCIYYAVEMFGRWISNPDGKNPIPTDYQPQIYCAAVACCLSQNLYGFLLEHYKTTKSPRQKGLVVQALACAESEDFLKMLLNKTIDLDDKDIDTIRHGDLLLESLALSRLGRKLAWDFIQENHGRISEIYGSNAIPSLIDLLVPYVSQNGIANIDNEVTSFIFNYISVGNGSLNGETLNSLRRSADKILENSYWMEYYYNDVRQWLTWP